MASGRRAGVNLQQVFQRRDRLAGVITTALDGSRDGAALERAARDCFRALGGTADATALFQSLMPLTDTTVAVRDIAWALAGNLAALRAGTAVRPGVWAHGPAWLAVQVVAARHAGGPDRRDRRVRLRLKALAGVGCPGVFEFVWTERRTRYLAGHPRGLGLGAAALRYRLPGHLAGMRFSTLVVPAGAGLRFVRLSTGAAMRGHNQTVATLRVRALSPCPRNYTHPCTSCRVGYDACPAGTHPRSYVPLGHCTSCGQAGDADPVWSAFTCVGCLALLG